MKSSSLSPGDAFILNYPLTNGGLSWAFQPLGKGTGPDAASGPGITSLEGSHSLILPKLPATFAHHPLRTHCTRVEYGEATYILPLRALAFCSSSRFLVGVGGVIPSFRQPAGSFKLPRYEPPSRLWERRINSLKEVYSEKSSGRPCVPPA